MPNIYIKHGEIESVMVCVANAKHRAEQKSSGINGLTALKVSKIIKDLQKEKEDYNEEKKALLDKYVEGGSEDPKSDKNNQYVFKSDEDKKKFLEVADSYAEVRMRNLLSDSDLAELNTIGMEIEFISRIVDSEANFTKPEEEVEEVEAEEEKPKKGLRKVEKEPKETQDKPE